MKYITFNTNLQQEEEDIADVLEMGPGPDSYLLTGFHYPWIVTNRNPPSHFSLQIKTDQCPRRTCGLKI